jgi:hypothetical protein
MEKIFCSRCYHLGHGCFGYICKHPKNTTVKLAYDDWFISGSETTPIIDYIQPPSIINCNNDCKNYLSRKPKSNIAGKPIIKKKWWKI